MVCKVASHEDTLFQPSTDYLSMLACNDVSGAEATREVFTNLLRKVLQQILSQTQVCQVCEMADASG